MRGAFVVGLRNTCQAPDWRESVEDADTGKHSNFLSENELIEFLLGYRQAPETDGQKKERNEDEDSLP
jgi:hypothetical protein